MHPCSSVDTTAAWKKRCFILSVRSDFHMTDSLSIAVHAFVSCVSTSLTATTQECCEQFWTSPGGNTPQSPNCTATKTIKVRRARHTGHSWRSKDELIGDVLLWTTHMAEQKQDDKLELTYSSSVRIRDVALRTYQKRWMIRRSAERGSEISLLEARHYYYYYYSLRVLHQR